jgi:hypothetical protein
MTTHNEDHIIVIRTYNDLGKATSAKERLEEADIKYPFDEPHHCYEATAV